MTLKKKEVFWLLGTLFLTLLVHFSLNGFNSLLAGSALDINIHDSFFVVPHIHFFLWLISFIFFVVYLLRAVFAGFNNNSANFILILASLALTLILTTVVSILHFFLNWDVIAEYPPLSGGSVHVKANGMSSAYYSVTVIQFLLVSLVAYTGYRTGNNLK